MDDADTATIELSRPEARGIISALTDYEVTQSGFEEERLLNLREHFRKEFGFEAPSDTEDQGWMAKLTESLFDDNAVETVTLSRAEAREVTAALSALERHQAGSDVEAVRDLRRAFEDAFDLETDETDRGDPQ